MISFELANETTFTVGDSRCCSECGSLNVVTYQEDDSLVRCSDCGLIGYPDDPETWNTDPGEL